jgi:hypothetical protein
LQSDPDSSYDIVLVDSDNDIYTKTNVKITGNQNITFSFDDLDLRKVSSPTITVTNRTGHAGSSLYIIPSSSNNWGSDLLDSDTLNNGQSITVNRSDLQPDPDNSYNVVLVDSSDNTYTRTNIRINGNQNITFIADDLD